MTLKPRWRASSPRSARRPGRPAPWPSAFTTSGRLRARRPSSSRSCWGRRHKRAGRGSAVSAEFLRKLMGRPAALPAEVAEGMAELTRLAAEKPALADAANILGDILPGLYADAIPSETVSITGEHAAAKLAGGVPL